MKKAMFGAGCFWGVQYNFDQIAGVQNTEVGYAGGHTSQPTYKDVCTDTTGHAEVVYVEYDESQVTFEALLDAFWKMHDPTQVNRQGVDIGTQYRTVIYFYEADQKDIAEKSKAELQKKLTRPIATDILPAPEFYKAEEYHQKYNVKNGVVCHI